MGLSGAAIGTYRPQYHPLSAIRYLDVNLLPTRYTLFITLYVGPIYIIFIINNYSSQGEMITDRGATVVDRNHYSVGSIAERQAMGKDELIRIIVTCIGRSGGGASLNRTRTCSL
jgi:hypothetical protein